jgi:uncharacterized membrane protein
VDNFWHWFFISLHLLGLTLFLGPQFFLAFAWVPASREIADLPTRLQATRTVTRRFGYIAGAGLILLVVAGVYLVSDWRDYYSVPDETGFTDLRFGVIFLVKMGLLVAMLAVLALHTFVLGPRLLGQLEARAAGQAVSEEEMRSFRMQSMAASVLVLLLTLGIMGLGVSLSTVNYSLQPR